MRPVSVYTHGLCDKTICDQSLANVDVDVDVSRYQQLMRTQRPEPNPRQNYQESILVTSLVAIGLAVALGLLIPRWFNA